jgi:hypothetical protein
MVDSSAVSLSAGGSILGDAEQSEEFIQFVRHGARVNVFLGIGTVGGSGCILLIAARAVITALAFLPMQ